jgi:hypothetical protein
MSVTMNRFRLFGALAGVLAVVACEKNQVQDITLPTIPSAAIHFFNFSPGSPGVNFYVNETKFTAVGTTACTPTPVDTTQARICRETGLESTTGVVNGGAGGGANGYYAAIEPGQYTISARIASATPPADKNLPIASTPATIEAGKHYSFITAGIYNTTAKSAESFVVEDPIPAAFDYANATVRFLNASANSSPMTLYAQSTAAGSVEIAIGGDVAYKSAGAFTTIPAGTYDLRTRVAGSATNIITRAAVAFVAGKVYTVSARGDITATTGTNARALDNTANR